MPSSPGHGRPIEYRDSCPVKCMQVASETMRSDIRNTPAPETPKPSPGKKDTRRWCKGKIGVEHDWSAPMLYAEARSVTPQEAALNNRERSYRIYVRKCRECGREEWVR